jgi:hypothetical protein
MANTDFQCYGSVTLFDPDGVITTCSANAFAWGSFSYVDLTEYGGDRYTPITNSASFVAAMEALGYSVLIQGCSIYFTDILKPAGEDIPVLNDPAISLVKDGSALCTGGAIPYSDFDYIDLTPYGGGEVEVADETALIAVFAALNIDIEVDGCDIILLEWGDQATSNVQAYDHERVTITAKYSDVVCSGGAIDYGVVTCIDLSNYGGSKTVEVASNLDILDALDPLVTPDIYMDGCDVVFKFEKTSQKAILAYGHQAINLVDTDENLGTICSNGVVDYSKFDYIDLSDYGGQSSVRVESNNDIIAAFGALGITVSFSGCDITVEECLESYPDVEVSAAPSISLVDTDENITVCSANNYQYANFDGVDLCAYDVNNVLADCSQVPVNSEAELEAAFDEIGIEAEVVGCSIRLYNWTGATPDVEVCKYPVINLVDNNGDQLCDGGTIPYSQIESIDMSAYGGPAAYSPVDQDSDIVDAFADVNIDVEVNGCDIEFLECYSSPTDVPALTVNPVMEASVEFTGGNEGEFTMTLGAYLLTQANVKVDLVAGDRINVKILSRNVDVDLIVGGTPTVAGSGYINDVGNKWQTEIVPNISGATQMTAAALKAVSYDLVFLKKRWANQVNLKYQTTGPSTARELKWDFRAVDVSANNMSTEKSITMKKIVTMINGFMSSTHLNNLTSRVEVYGEPTLNPVSSIEHLIAGTSYPVTSVGKGYNNGIEYERFEGSPYLDNNINKAVDITVVRDNGFQSVSKGYLRQDADFLVRVICATGGTQYCTISPYGEHEDGSQPSSWGFSFQVLEEYLFSGPAPVPPGSPKVIYDGVTFNVTLTQPAPGLWNSSIVQLTGLVPNTQHTLRCEARDAVYNNLAWLEMDLEIVYLY